MRSVTSVRPSSIAMTDTVAIPVVQEVVRDLPMGGRPGSGHRPDVCGQPSGADDGSLGRHNMPSASAVPAGVTETAARMRIGSRGHV